MKFLRRRLERAQQKVEDLVLDGDQRAAEAAALQALRRYPRDGRLCILLARSRMGHDRTGAIQAANRAVEAEPTSPKIVLDATWILLPLDPQRGREVGELAHAFELQNDSDRALAMYLRGRYSLLDDQAEAAEEYFRQAHSIKPVSETFAEALVDSLMLQGKREEARQVSDRALKTVFDRDLLDRQRVRLGF